MGGLGGDKVTSGSLGVTYIGMQKAEPERSMLPAGPTYLRRQEIPSTTPERPSQISQLQTDVSAFPPFLLLLIQHGNPHFPVGKGHREMSLEPSFWVPGPDSLLSSGPVSSSNIPNSRDQTPRWTSHTKCQKP